MYKTKEIEKMVKGNEYYSSDDFIRDAKRYVKAIKEGRIICDIASVSRSGMSRKMKFLECHRNSSTGNYQYLTFFGMYRALGYNPKRDGLINISGCGMDMVFHTNYNVIYKLCFLRFITRDTRDHLCQQTPTVI